MKISETKKFVIRCRAIIIDEGKLLVVIHPHNTSFSALPGGHLEWGEDIKECLRRELVEELGITPEIGRLLYINNFMDGDDTQSIEFFFEVLNSRDYKNIKNFDANEISAVSWVLPTDTTNILPKGLEEDFKAGKILSDEVRYIYKV